VDGGTIVGSAMNFTLLSTWARYSATFLVPTNCVNLVAAVWSNDVLAFNDDVLLTECGLYDGQEILDWICLPRNVELLRCQRFFCKTFNAATAPAQNAGALTGEARIPSPVGASTAFPACWTWEFPVTMFKAPTLTIYNPQAANAQVRNQTLATDCTASAATADGDKRCLIAATTPASTVAGTNILGIHISADAEI
jgi:hypothetical protein